MGLFKPVRRAANAHSVRLYLPLAGPSPTDGERDAARDLQDDIDDAVEAVVGTCDEYAFADGAVVFMSHGPDADALYRAIHGCLATVELLPGAYVVKRYGPADDPAAPEERVDLF